MDAQKEDHQTQEVTEVISESMSSISTMGAEEGLIHQKEHSSKKPVSTLKEENDKLRTYLGLVKMCNNSAINKIKCAISETMDAIQVSNETPINPNLIYKQLEVIQNEITNMQSMHSQLEEGIEAFQVIENSTVIRTAFSATEDGIDTNKEAAFGLPRQSIEVPRKPTGLKRTVSSSKSTNKMKRASKEAPIEVNLLSRINPKGIFKGITTYDSSQLKEMSSEEHEAVANIDMSSTTEDRENMSQISDPMVPTEPYVIKTKVTKRPYISEEFKTSHLQRLEEAKRRREEMNRQLEREGKRRPKFRRADDQMKDMSDMGKKSQKKRPIKKKVVGKVVKKKVQPQPIATAQSIVVPINQSTLDSLSGQTIQIIASGGTQILCRNDGTFIPASNNNQWQTTGQWAATTATDVNLAQNQWNQYQS